MTVSRATLTPCDPDRASLLRETRTGDYGKAEYRCIPLDAREKGRGLNMIWAFCVLAVIASLREIIRD